MTINQSINQSIYYNSSAAAEMGDRLATIDNGRKVWGTAWVPV